MTKTYSPKPADIDRSWFLVDGDGLRLGRLATVVASTLRGKHKPMYTPHEDTGDFVIVVNAEKVVLTGRKEDQKLYRRHSNRPGGLKEQTAREVRAKKPEMLVESAVKGMLPKNSLGRRMFRKLKVYAGAEHPHEAQQPQALDIPGAQDLQGTADA
ncbi:MAG: 50S ribosomal protein L13 [Thermoanaerobaculia bacterium]|nr:50S ribosomal protein L13 [Thermoanaerobaculia bacterium]